MFLPAKASQPIALLILFVLLFAFYKTAEAQQQTIPQGENVLWREPGNIASRNLRWGVGSESRAPAPPFRFLQEDKYGDSPKFKVRDARNVEWSVKLGVESQAETVVTRLVWAVGYFAEEAYYFDRVQISDLPRLSRGREFVEANTYVHGARFEPHRENLKRGAPWDWAKNPFVGTRELDGLKILMILFNNYDARTANNGVLTLMDEQGRAIENRYVVTDLGATLGKAAGMGGGRSKNNLGDFVSTRFVRNVEGGIVNFDYDTRPTKLGTFAALNPFYYKGEAKKENDMRGIPVAHARWIGLLLGQLTDEQLRDAFRAAEYKEEIREGFVRALRERINQLTRL